MLPLGRLALSFPSTTGKARLAYAESYVAIEFLVKNYGWTGIERVLRRTGELRRFDVAFAETFGLSVADFEYAYFYFLKKRYRSLRLVIETFPFWSVLTLLFLLVYVVKRLRARRRLAAMGDFSLPHW